MGKFNLSLLFLFISITLTTAQENLTPDNRPHKILNAQRISESPTVDGVLNDAVWQNITPSGDFNMYQPGNEGNIPQEFQSQVKMAYTDKAIYIAVYMYDPNPEGIFRQYSQRDDVFAQADRLAIAINTYNDGINETRFYVTSAGTIGDSRVSSNDQDFGYNVVFSCQISYDQKGWYAEFEIPYNALRFPEKEIQDWSINFYREIKTRNETHTWSFINNSIGKETQYNGLITNLKDIDPPVRLTLFPFAQGVISQFGGETETNVSAGLDLKYGLSDSFTLDATLIPDFGQAAFDEVELNLGPFEQTFRENRQFFSEGIELFKKGGIFFSRRIGNAPSGIAALEDEEKFLENPSRVKLLNAVKISGRTKNNLGIGVLNTVTGKTKTVIQDTVTGVIREVVTEPISNYNVFVLDQQFNGNSSISLINTNVTRDGSFRDANVSALAFDVADSGNNYRTSGRAIVNNVNEPNGFKTGFRSELDIFRIKGNFRYRVGHDFANRTFDINDLGVNFTNNYNNFVAGVSYEIFEPTTVFNRYRFSLTARHRRLYKPSVQTRNDYSFDTFFFTINRFAFGLNGNYSTKNKDYFEPRVDGRFVIFPAALGGRGFISTDFRKKFAYDIGVGARVAFNDPSRSIFVDVSPRYRFSNKFAMILSSEYAINNDEFGYIDNTEEEIFFGQRDRKSIENSITASYNFDPFKAIDLRFRNFWSTADYSDNIFFSLNEDGTKEVTPYDISENDPNTNFNIWNLDLGFRWRFAPGSEASLLYRNQIFKIDEMAQLGYAESLQNLFEQDQQHTLSLRITYFIDYNNVKYLFNKKA
ncbi:DUF5916 domain-containing protein [Marinirhabdus gelatinilytica]|uniref:DUF5916 domain-containing protein n=1 Tax=Marinirhabdus gelatinilytica TaxID=1703343 RepID=A0A370QAJ5_9FLAO|nr:DUF5916 domain-containing protein [Marinirhabdus gelatinilytica]RDK85396.1 hypothetical protein C8D94_103221 [Marinirhabdus gelatinilytica]